MHKMKAGTRASGCPLYLLDNAYSILASVRARQHPTELAVPDYPGESKFENATSKCYKFAKTSIKFAVMENSCIETNLTPVKAERT